MKKRIRMYTALAAMTVSVVMGTLAAAAPKGMAAQTEGYIVKSWCGKVAVYSTGGAEPVETTDIELKNLPSADRKQLETGIYIQNDEELAQILEDLGS